MEFILIIPIKEFEDKLEFQFNKHMQHPHPHVIIATWYAFVPYYMMIMHDDDMIKILIAQ